MMLVAIAIMSMNLQVDACYRHDTIKITRMHPRISVEEAFKREGQIRLRIPVDCSSHDPIVPKTWGEALSFYDDALPSDYRKALPRGDGGFSGYAYTTYGASVDDDVASHIADLWGTGYCQAQLQSSDAMGCAYELLDATRAGYVPQAPEYYKSSEWMMTRGE